MNKPIGDTVLEILNIINYSNDKAKFIEEFLSANCTDALINLAEKLPEDIKAKSDFRRDDFTGFTDEDVAKVKQYVSDEDFTKELERISKDEIKKMVEPVLPKLSEEQKVKVNALIQSLDAEAVPAAVADAPVPASTFAYPPAPDAAAPSAPQTAPVAEATTEPVVAPTPEENSTT